MWGNNSGMGRPKGAPMPAMSSDPQPRVAQAIGMAQAQNVGGQLPAIPGGVHNTLSANTENHLKRALMAKALRVPLRR